jgi:hypothetical protein
MYVHVHVHTYFFSSFTFLLHPLHVRGVLVAQSSKLKASKTNVSDVSQQSAVFQSTVIQSQT